ncbi:acyltransferase family protein [Flectobacillus roseus]|uniref:acyltransferase family protein n=1 Tax=Flectobacillus roseus TaxID=502259 RepID=UPI0035B5D823
MGFNNKEFGFVNTLRFVSMLSIVIFHTFQSYLNFNNSFRCFDNEKLFSIFSILQVGRFGNISFFFISGLLLGNKLKDNYKKNEVISPIIVKRIKFLIKPLIVISTFNLLSSLIYIYVIENRDYDLIELIKNTISMQWFIVILFTCFALLRIMNTSKRLLVLLIILTLVSVYIGLNCYFLWFSIRVKYKSITFLAFLLYLPLGFFFGVNENYWHKLVVFVRKYFITFAILTFLFYLISVFDSFYLVKIAVELPFNNAKLSNQLFSLCFLLTFCSTVNSNVYPKFLKPRNETIGIFFIHQVFIFIINVCVKLEFLGKNLNNKPTLPSFFKQAYLFNNESFVFLSILKS